MSKEALKLALEALVPFEKLFMQADEKDLLGGQNIDCQIATTDLRKLAYAAADLRKALAEQPAQQYSTTSDHRLMEMPAQQQEPVSWLKVIETPGGWGKFVEAKPHEKGAKPVYTSPPASKPWVGLTDDEIAVLDVRYHRDNWKLIKEAEAKLKEKNA